MPKAYSDDLRIRLVEAVESGATCRVAASQYDVSVSTVVRVLQKWRSSGSCSPGQMGGSKQHKLEPHGALVDNLLAGTCDITLEELRVALAASDVKVSCTAIHRYLRARGLTRKKRQGTQPSRSGRTSPPRASSGAKSSHG